MPTLTCSKCSEEVSGPNDKDVAATMKRHLSKKHLFSLTKHAKKAQ